ncbi:hypothetical protein OC834_001579 [Tilletia horrida]|nr:hypothetical protein OC834_001579 [Tilletia horrida]
MAPTAAAANERPAASFPARPRTRSRLSTTSNPAAAALYAKAAEDAARNPNLRRLSLLGSFLVALSAGSNYAFSSWAPQMQEAAHLSSTSLNVVGLAGNAGVYLSGPFVGRWVDKSGPRQALVFGAILVAAGYASLSASFTGSWSFHSTTSLAFFNLLTGLGNSAAFAAAMNAQAKSWDGTKRGSATAFVLSGFGLSAFFYSTLSHSLFPGNTADYLLLLSLGSAAFYILGYFIIRVLPPADSPILRRIRTSSSAADGSGLDASSATGNGAEHDPEAPGLVCTSSSSASRSNRRRSSSDIGARVWLTADETSSAGEEEDDDEEEEEEDQERQGLLRNGAPTPVEEEGRDGGLRRAASHAVGGKRRVPGSEPQSAASGSGSSSSAAAAASSTGAVDITGRKLIRNTDFILLFAIMAAISGSGLLLINNCGTITRTLYDYNKRKNGAGGGGEVGDGLGLAAWLGGAVSSAVSVGAGAGAGAQSGPASLSSASPSSSALASPVAASSAGRSWPELLRLFGSSVNANKVAYNPPHKPLLPLGRPFSSRDLAAAAGASSAAVSATASSSIAAAAGLSSAEMSPLVLDEHALVQQLQAHQVSAISLGNALGRIIIGLLSDVLVNYTSPPMRVWLLTLVCLLAVSSQALAAMPNVITTVHRLLIVSSLTGLMYGTLFGISPSLAFEWFGVKHFSQNWGIVSLSPVVAGNIFNLLFGRVFDAHVPASSPSHQCPYGEECYRSVFVVTLACCLVATALSLVLIVRRAGWPTRSR